MFFELSKIFWIVVQPLALSAMLIAAGTILLARRRRRTGMALSIAGLLVISLSSFTTIGHMLIAPLENRFSPPSQMPDTVDVIVLLGGATQSGISTVRQVAELNAAGDRLTETLYLARLYPEARVLVSGGVGFLASGVETEATTAQRFLTRLGLAPERLILEGAARNTDENASETKALLGQATGTIVLVTSAFHMPRSVGLFRKADLEVIAWPTDYRSAGDEGFTLDLDSPVTNLETTSVALREWIGLLAYHLTGRMDEIFPAQASN